MKTLKESLIDAADNFDNQVGLCEKLRDLIDYYDDWGPVQRDVEEVQLNDINDEKHAEYYAKNAREFLGLSEFKKYKYYKDAYDNFEHIRQCCLWRTPLAYHKYKGDFVKLDRAMVEIKSLRLAINDSNNIAFFDLCVKYPFILKIILIFIKHQIEKCEDLMDNSLEEENKKEKSPYTKKQYDEFVKYYNSKMLPIFKNMTNLMEKIYKDLLTPKNETQVKSIYKDYNKESKLCADTIKKFILKSYKSYYDEMYPDGMDDIQAPPKRHPHPTIYDEI